MMTVEANVKIEYLLLNMSKLVTEFANFNHEISYDETGGIHPDLDPTQIISTYPKIMDNLNNLHFEANTLRGLINSRLETGD